MKTINIKLSGETFEDYIFNAISGIIHELDFEGIEPNLVNVISMTCGWNMLQHKESMYVRYGKDRYRITRLDGDSNDIVECIQQAE